MASKVSNVLRVIGRHIPDAGSVMYHAKDGVGRDGAIGKDKRHKIRYALAKQRLRASGMSDDINGSKETDGSMQNPYEQKPKRRQ